MDRMRMIESLIVSEALTRGHGDEFLKAMQDIHREITIYINNLTRVMADYNNKKGGE